MNCRNCDYFITLPTDQIERDLVTNEACKYSCSKHRFEKITEKGLKNRENESRWCFAKNEVKVTLVISLLSLIVSLLGVIPLWMEERLTQEDVKDIIDSYKLKESSDFVGKTDSIMEQ